MANMGRHGAGSIVSRKHGPPFHATLIVGGRRLFRYARTREEAERAMDELQLMRKLDLDPTRQTVADFLRSWVGSLRDARRQRIRPRTLEPAPRCICVLAPPKDRAIDVAAKWSRTARSRASARSRGDARMTRRVA